MKDGARPTAEAPNVSQTRREGVVLLDIGAKRPIEGDRVYLVGRYRTNEPPYVLTYDPSKFTARTRYGKRNLAGVEPEDLVVGLGGADEFGRIDVPTWGTAWIRRSMVLDVVEMPESMVRLAKPTFGAVVLMRFESPLLPNSFLPAGTPFGFGAHGLAVEQVKTALQRSGAAD